MNALKQSVLLPYQLAWINDKSKLRLWEKSRRIGASFTLALEAVLSGAVEGGVNTYYLSYNKDMTRQFVKDCAFWCEKLQAAFNIIEEKIVNDENKDITVFRITLASGKEILALPSAEYSLRGKQGNVILDEAAFVDNFEEVKKAALALLIWGGRFSILSTHNGSDNPFNVFIQKIRRGEEKDWSLHFTTFDNAVHQGLYKKICQSNKQEWTKTQEKAFVEEIYRIYKDNADEELRCIPRKAGTVYFPRMLLEPCIDDAIPVIRKAFDDDFVKQRKTKKEKTIYKFFKNEIAPHLKELENLTFFGFDFGRSGDLSVFWLLEKDNETLKSRIVIEIRNCPFDEQFQLLLLICEALSTLAGGKLDGRGNGQMIAEKMEIEYPGLAEKVMISNNWYARIMPIVKSSFEEQSVTVPNDEYVLGDFRTVQIVKGIPKITERTSENKKGTQRHGDSMIALALAEDASLEETEEPDIVSECTGNSMTHDALNYY